MTTTAADILVHKVLGWAGNQTYHRPNVQGRSRCGDRVLEPAGVPVTLVEHEGLLCGSRACDLAGIARTMRSSPDEHGVATPQFVLSSSDQPTAEDDA